MGGEEGGEELSLAGDGVEVVVVLVTAFCRFDVSHTKKEG
jgi:hypothetical protein